MHKPFDVMVVGAGPAGCATAKRCLELGLETVLIEKREMPREKVCSGMLIGETAKGLVQQVFGTVPTNVYSSNSPLEGCTFHVSGQRTQSISMEIPVTWRSKLDKWMLTTVAGRGVQVLENTRMIDWAHEGQCYNVNVKSDTTREIKCRFLIGADGANSTIRKTLFPAFNPKYGHIYQEVHVATIPGFDNGVFHWFYPEEIFPSSISAHHKDGKLILDINTRPGNTRPLWEWTKNFLKKEYNTVLQDAATWKGACLEPVFWKELTEGVFIPGSENILLIGDAAGVLMPVTGEGIGNGILSGMIAADSIGKSLDSGKMAIEFFQYGLVPLLAKIRSTIPWFKRMREAASLHDGSLVKVLADAYSDTLQSFA